MLKKAASFVLTSLRGSTYRSVRLASSLAAALLDSLFEHPAGVRLLSRVYRSIELRLVHRVFQRQSNLLALGVTDRLRLSR